MNIKGLLALALAAVLMLSLCACGDDVPSAVDAYNVSTADVSTADVSGADVSPSDWRAALTDEEAAVANVVISSTDAFNSEDIEAYMSTVDPQSKVYDFTKESAELVFKRYQLNATINNLKVKLLDKSAAEVYVTQTTVAAEETKYSFTPVETHLIHKMVRRGDRWFITSTEVESRKEITDYWGALIDVVANEVPGIGGLSGSDQATYADEAEMVD